MKKYEKTFYNCVLQTSTIFLKKQNYIRGWSSNFLFLTLFFFFKIVEYYLFSEQILVVSFFLVPFSQAHRFSPTQTSTFQS
jgi:hypothetical protein